MKCSCAFCTVFCWSVDQDLPIWCFVFPHMVSRLLVQGPFIVPFVSCLMLWRNVKTNKHQLFLPEVNLLPFSIPPGKTLAGAKEWWKECRPSASRKLRLCGKPEKNGVKSGLEMESACQCQFPVSIILVFGATRVSWSIDLREAGWRTNTHAFVCQEENFHISTCPYVSSTPTNHTRIV